MAHDFLGTFNRTQFERFIKFARSQTGLIADRIQHLEAEKYRLGALVFRHDPSNGDPVGYSVTPPDSYLAKLMAAYEILGGSPFLDLDVRLLNDPIFKLSGTETAMSNKMSNGMVVGVPGLADAPSATLFAQARGWLDGTLVQRRDYLERKIRRVIDYSDALQAEINLLRVVSGGADSDGSLEWVYQQMQQLFSDPLYRAIADDVSSGTPDPRGTLAYAPFSAYDTDGTEGRIAETDQREGLGYVRGGSSAGKGSST